MLDFAAESNLIPVIAPIGTDAEGHTYNINADLVASAIASAFRQKNWFYSRMCQACRMQTARLPTLNANAVHTMIEEGVISGGMLPKIQCALDAVQQASIARTLSMAELRMRYCLKC